ncbi:MAG: aminotransferase class III-fold pyridoxal phosphate-dependent enzyme [Deltaproteobacteria bacterium]|nr:MAG: aminotransferase class III-fold pyridoxal phosphate-dependent enzyme [Deltaproteobacteria bacterium]
MYGHMKADMLPEGYPQFFERGDGCRIWDVDGHEYIDFVCSYGPIVLGHRHPAVEAAAARQLASADCQNGPAAVFVELAERMVDVVPAADWAMFCKNGNDATTLCVTIARAATGKRKVLAARGAYHGSLPWCTEFRTGVTDEDQAHLIHYTYNDLASVEAAREEAGDDLAAILVSAFQHDAFVDQALPEPAFARRLREICDRTGAALLLDDVRAGFRLHRGGSWEGVGVRPDLSAWGKALANGWPISAVTGVDALRRAATRVFATGSYWFGAAPMAAALATLEALDASDALGRMRAAGQTLRDGLDAQARSHGFSLRQTGPVQMPMVLFEDDPERATGNRFCSEALKRGVYLHPWHNMFLCAAHTPDDVKQALERTDEAFAALRRSR